MGANLNNILWVLVIDVDEVFEFHLDQRQQQVSSIIIYSVIQP